MKSLALALILIPTLALAHPLGEEPDSDSFPLGEHKNNTSQTVPANYLTCEQDIISNARNFAVAKVWTGLTWCAGDNGEVYKGKLNSITSKFEIIQFETDVSRKKIRFLLKRK